MRGFGAIVIVISIFFLGMIIGGYLIFSSTNLEDHIDEGGQVFEPPRDSSVTLEPPEELSLPFKIIDIDVTKGELNPLGIVRFSKDEGRVGHPGIDFPLIHGSEIYAVADGPVVLIESAGDPWNGMKVVQLLSKTGEGEGWAFAYEHVHLSGGYDLGDKLLRGDLIGTKGAPEGFTAHFQLTKVFNKYQFTMDPFCWPNNLKEIDSQKLNGWWREYKQSDYLINAWSSTKEEGKYPFKGLLEVALYPDGPKMCYELGTDVR